jgi:uncharacterized membrane protein
MTTMSAPESTSDDRLWAALAYVFSPLVPIILLLWAEKKDRPFIKAHNMQALVLGIVLFVIWMILTVTVVGLFLFCIPILLWIYMLYCAYQAYQGKLVNVPVISGMVKGQS